MPYLSCLCLVFSCTWACRPWVVCRCLSGSSCCSCLSSTTLLLDTSGGSVLFRFLSEFWWVGRWNGMLGLLGCAYMCVCVCVCVCAWRVTDGWVGVTIASHLHKKILGFFFCGLVLCCFILHYIGMCVLIVGCFSFVVFEWLFLFFVLLVICCFVCFYCFCWVLLLLFCVYLLFLLGGGVVVLCVFIVFVGCCCFGGVGEGDFWSDCWVVIFLKLIMLLSLVSVLFQLIISRILNRSLLITVVHHDPV